MKSFLTIMLEQIERDTGRPFTAKESRDARRIILADEHRMKLDAFKQRMKQDAEAMLEGPLKID